MRLLWWRYDKIDVVTRFTVDECLVLLRGTTDAEKIFGRNDYNVVAQVGNRSFRIRKHESLHVRNFCEPVVYGRLTEVRTGTRIECRIGPQRLAVGLALFAQLAFWAIIATGIGRGPVLNTVIQLLLSTLFITLGMSFGRWIGRKNAAFLLDFLRMVLKARPEEPGLPRHSLAAAERRSRAAESASSDT